MEPMLRFKADDGSDFPDWEEMTLGDVGSVAMCKRVFKEQTHEVGDVPFFKIGTFGDVPDAYISQSLFDELKSKYAYPKVGTILLSASGTIGRQVEYNGEDAYYQDSNIVWLEHDDTVLDSYLKQFYSVVKWQGLEGSTIKRLYNKTILDTPFYRPSLPEQRKIADLLSAVDDVIAAQEAEVAAWEKRKKGVMQKLFSQEVRFKADDGSDFPDWEEKTLGDVGSVAMCKRVFKEQTREVGDVPFFKIGTFGDVPDAYISKSLFDELKSKYAYPKVGTILLSASGTIGRQVEYNGEDAYYQDSNIVWLEHDDTVLDSYLKQFYSVVKWQGLEGSTIKRLYNKTILDTPFYRPSLPEQRKIAECLALLDDVIAKAKDELDAWRELKKGLLQQMFV